MDAEIFDADSLAYRSLEDFVAYKEMHDFVNNQFAMDAHKGSMSYRATAPDRHAEGTDTELQSHLEQTIKKSLFHFASQTIVTLCTTYELAARNFFKCLFVRYPLLMHDYVGEENQRGTIKLKDIVLARDYAEVINNVAEKAAGVASKGKYGELLRRAAKLCKCTTEIELIMDIDQLQNLRNKIVHEKHITSFGVVEVADAQDTIFNSIKTLGQFALKKEVPGKYTVISPIPMQLESIAFLTNKI